MEQTQSIKNLIEDIDAKKIFLPEFQRDFVWEVSKTYDLFDSLIKDIFIGAIIYGIPSFDIAVREIDNRRKITKGRKRPSLEIKTVTKSEIEKINKTGGNFRLILDGQQRSTSIYRALKGTDEIWFIAKSEDEIESPSFESAKLEELLEEITGEQSSERLSIRLSDVWEIEQNDYDEDDVKEKFFFTSTYYKNYSSTAGFDFKGEFKKFRNLKKKIADLFKSEKLLSFYLLDMNLEKFVVFFERSNTRGVQLNFIDILAAKLYTGNFNLKEKIKEFEQKHQNYNLIPEIIVRAIAYRKSSPKEINRNYILTSLNAEDFKEWWDKICLSYKRTLDYLYDNHYIISQDWIPYDNMMIPLINFVNEIGGDYHFMSSKQKRFIDFWYWNSIFSLRYSGSSNERIIEDSNALTIIANDKKITYLSFFNKLTKIQTLSVEDIYSFDKKANAVYKGLLNIISYEKKGLLNWNNDAKLSLNSTLEDHHIFPKSYLNKSLTNEIDRDLIDCVANRTLVPKIQNIRISDQPPSEYLSTIQLVNPNIGRSLESHLITSELLTGEYDKEFNFFVELRASAIFDIVNKHVIVPKDSIKEEFYEEVRFEETANINVYCSYKSNKASAVFNPSTAKIFYKGDLYESPSAAANAVKIDLGAPEHTTENGWTFWKFVDESGMEKRINEFRK
ncbi:hypothetical protein SAMN05421823_102716 [Catalinimonas alkaloidigena]|uniref:GmrSD restriction endonucleases N-terminal domain-containing protein n=1 Tax=Catalinimonas alkaloidigena TaxID=1075417 RepID=A0A1G9BUJ7_9BACT|nr:DUF262 domain-containing protein [Catalinimonas alkaloidigena]SDK43107.1 hypothetical protein SAMN05421823_102716 [Catalinimonas alkaloidigena]